jgi:hypothetical protein
MTEIMAFDPKRTTNAQAIADLAALGILRWNDHIIDLTVGPKAGFWKLWRPSCLTTNDLDLNVKADMHFDVTKGLPFAYDVTVWDPPYGYRGTSRLASDANYGLGKYRSADEVDELLLAGTREALRLAKRLALVKCQDQNVASEFRDQSGFVCELARSLGARVAQKLYVNAYRKQPNCKRQLNVWGHPSVLLVLEKGRR